MVQTTKNELSKSVSNRIDEILRLTTLPLQSFARISNINIRTLNGYYQGTIPITLESILKICTVLSLDLNEFCDFKKKLNYFVRPRTLFQMLVDFSRDYNISIQPERLKALLQRCITKGLIKKHETPWNYGIGYRLPKRTWIYFKNEKLLLEDPKKIFGYNWISKSIIV